MRRAGLLETMANGDLEAVTRAVGRGYRPGSVERLAARDPAWGEALEQAEREVGTLYATLCEADGDARALAGGGWRALPPVVARQRRTGRGRGAGARGGRIALVEQVRDRTAAAVSGTRHRHLVAVR